MYQVMKAFAKTFMLGDKYDRVACCKFFSVWFSISDQTTSAPNDEYHPHFLIFLTAAGCFKKC